MAEDLTPDDHNDLIECIINEHKNVCSDLRHRLITRTNSDFNSCHNTEGIFVQVCIQNVKDQNWTKRQDGGEHKYPYYYISQPTLDGDAKSPGSLLDRLKAYVDKVQEKERIENIQSQLKVLINQILLEIVECSKKGVLEQFLDWINNELFTIVHWNFVWTRWKQEMKGRLTGTERKYNLIQPMIEASLNDEHEKVLVFLRNGFSVNDSLFKPCEVNEKSDLAISSSNPTSFTQATKFPLFLNRVFKGKRENTSQEMLNFMATSKPAYMLAEFVHEMKMQLRNYEKGRVTKIPENDPISEALHNSHIARNLTVSNSMSNNYNLTKIKEILRTSRKFVVDMLDQCRSSKEAITFLSTDTKLDHYFHESELMKSTKRFSRLHMAVANNHLELATHDYSQHILGTNWIMSDVTGEIIQWNSTTFIDQLFYIMMCLIMMPVYVLFFFVGLFRNISYYKEIAPEIPIDTVGNDSQNGWVKRLLNTLCTHYTVPINRCIGACMGNFMFLVFIYLSLVNINDEPKHLDPDWYDYCTFIWSFAYVYESVFKLIIYFIHLCQYTSVLSENYKTQDQINRMYNQVRNLVATKGFKICGSIFSSLGSTCVFTGCLFIALGFREVCVENAESTNEMENGESTNATTKTFSWYSIYQCRLDNPTELQDHLLVKTGYGLFGSGAILSTIKILYWFQLNNVTGPLIISMRKVFKDIFRIMVLHMFFLIIFSIGMNYVLRISDSYCSDKERNVTEHSTPFDIEDLENKFRFLRTSFKASFWSLFDPGHPEVVGCTEGHLRYLGMGMWAIYQFLNSIILLNLLIALMNARIMNVNQNRIHEWQFVRTEIWMSYFDKTNSVPVPFNLLEDLLQLGIWIYHKTRRTKVPKNDVEMKVSRKGSIVDENEKQEIEKEISSSNRDDLHNLKEYNQLMMELIKRYIKNVKGGKKYCKCLNE